jgi:hypothetical protein
MKVQICHMEKDFNRFIMTITVLFFNIFNEFNKMERQK